MLKVASSEQPADHSKQENFPQLTGLSISDIDSSELFITIKALDNSGTIQASSSEGAVLLEQALDGSSIEISGKSGAINAGIV